MNELSGTPTDWTGLQLHLICSTKRSVGRKYIFIESPKNSLFAQSKESSLRKLRGDGWWSLNYV